MSSRMKAPRIDRAQSCTEIRGRGGRRLDRRPDKSLAAYQNEAIVICAPCSSRRLGGCWSGSGLTIGSAMGSNRVSKRGRSDCITTSSPSRSPTSSTALFGAVWLTVEHSSRASCKSHDQSPRRLTCRRLRETAMPPLPSHGCTRAPGRVNRAETIMMPPCGTSYG
jgi:hypothetical protein